MKKVLYLSLIASLVFAFLTVPAIAGDNWPQKPIRLTICFGAGGTTDMSTRMLASIIEQNQGWQVICQNKPGGSGSVAASLIKNKKPDGYNLFTYVTAAAVINPHRQNLPYDPIKDFTPICRYGAWHDALVVKADSPFKTLHDLINYTKAHPGEVSYGISGLGTVQHLVMERLKTEAGIDWKAIPFKSGTEAVSAAMGGHVTAMAGATEWLPQVKAGEMRLLCVFDPGRMKEFPDVPTVKELGYDIEAASMLGIAGPAGLPEEVVVKVDKAVKKAMKDPKMIELMDKIMVMIHYMDHNEFTDYIAKLYKEQGEILRQCGLAKK